MRYLPLFCTPTFLGRFTAFIAGILLPFAFAPFNYFLLAIVSPALLLGLWFDARPREAFLRGWWYGLGYFGIGVSWIYVSIHDYGNTPVVVSGLLTFLFVGFLALFPAVQGYVLQWLFPDSPERSSSIKRSSSINLSFPRRRESILKIYQKYKKTFCTKAKMDSRLRGNDSKGSRNDSKGSGDGKGSGNDRFLDFLPNCLKALLYFPASWTLIEWVRSWILTGFPWLQLAHSQVNSPLAGFIPLVGVFGVTALVAFLSGLLYLLYAEKRWTKKIILLLAILIIFIVGFLLRPIQWTTVEPKPLNVSLVQGNIPQAIKWSPGELDHILKLYPHLSESVWTNSDLVVWPEAAVTLPVPWSLKYLNHLLKTIRSYPVSLITGVPVQAQNSWRYYNAMVLLGDGFVDIYYKRYLVPFGEYVPFENWLRGVIGFFDLPMSDFISGGDSQAILKNKQRFMIAPFICYEIAYPNAILTTVPKANLMVVISNDTWFGNSLAPCQHLQIAQFAAISAGRYLLFSTNDGITAVIDPKGQVVASAPRFEQAILKHQVFLMNGSTPWVTWGHNYLLIILGLSMITGRFFRKT